MDLLVRLGIIKKGLMACSSPVLLLQRKHKHYKSNNQKVCRDFCVLNYKLLKINDFFHESKTTYM